MGLSKDPEACSLPPLSPSTLAPMARIAVITGASSGIGAATAEALATDGFDVVLGARRLEQLEGIADEVGGEAIVLDVTDPTSVEQFAAHLPRCDVLVNNPAARSGSIR